MQLPFRTAPSANSRRRHRCRCRRRHRCRSGQGALAGRVDGKLVDLSHVIDKDAQVAIITGRDAEGVEIIRHSTAHLMAQAVKELYPEAQVTIGPAIENGFYYDFSYSRPFTPEDLKAIEERMDEIVKRNIKIERIEMSRDEAVKFFTDLGEKYKAELIEAIPQVKRSRSTVRATSPTSAAAPMCRPRAPSRCTV